MMGSAVRLGGVTHRYGRTLALDNVDLEIPAGVMAGLIGPDGVGKSTLLGLAAGVKRLQSGTLEVLGETLEGARVRREMRARVAYMPQGLGRNLYPTLTVAENLHFFGRLFGQDRAERTARIAELLAATGLAPFADRAAGKLSGGMKQKLGICTALIHDPDLLVLDEPTTGIDPLSRRQFWALIDRVRARRPSMSILVATAYMEEAEGFDWLAALHAGRILATGRPDEIEAVAGVNGLERAFVALLPEAAERDEEGVAVPPPLAEDGPVAVEAEGLTRRFGTFTAVDHVSFKISRGEIFGFLGSNGSGKSTTMKMLTGLLPASEGEARLFGKPLAAGDIETRRRVGYMSQSFSLYGELTVRQNLVLHARLFGLRRPEIGRRVGELLTRFDLAPFAGARPESLPLGIRQRLQLAVAVLHKPEVLILDEPTSGVDPIARDSFWRLLIALSREDGVTIFLSTHFMNEAERCDRISLMHEGRVLAVGRPAELKAERSLPTLEAVFIAVLEEAGDTGEPSGGFAEEPVRPAARVRRLDPKRLWAFAWREGLEILRDPARLAFAFAGPMLLLIAFGYGISFDVEDISLAVYDQDQSLTSRRFIENFEGSRYFEVGPPITSAAELEERLRSGELTVALEIPPNFGSEVLRGEETEVGAWLDGAMPFRAETARGYVAGVAERATRDLLGATPASIITIEPRFRYNQAFRSADAMVPGVIMLLLVLIPAIMTAVGVVKEKETGSITNFRAAPAAKIEFLAGKQLPYVAIGFISFLVLVTLASIVFGVGVSGSFAALAVGSLGYVFATTGFGLFLSSFLKSQVAAVFATAIITIIPAVNFSGLLVPVSALTGMGRAMGLMFPPGWYTPISVGAFSKGAGFAALWPNILVVFAFGLAFLAGSALVLRKEEK